jgi:hypothetical protein
VAWLVVVAAPLALAQSDPLPSWNDGGVKKSITDFVTRVTAQGGADFVPVEQRSEPFDNDGTLWTARRSDCAVLDGRRYEAGLPGPSSTNSSLGSSQG